MDNQYKQIQGELYSNLSQTPQQWNWIPCQYIGEAINSLHFSYSTNPQADQFGMAYNSQPPTFRYSNTWD